MQNIDRRKSLLAAVILICFVAVVLLSSLFIVTHIDHECTGHDCPICHQIQIAENSLQQIGICLVVFFFSIVATFRFRKMLCRNGYNIVLSVSPVSLKVRMNN